MPLNLIMLGPPGAGKGTQAERFARARGVPKISTGDILRDAVHEGTELGLKARATMDRGDLVSDEIMIGIVRDRLGLPDAAGGFVLDGFPRTRAQAAALDTILDGRGPLLIVTIAVSERELVRRIASRRICDNCGATDAAFDLTDVGTSPITSPITSPGAVGGDGEIAVTAFNAQTGVNTCRRCGRGVLIQRADDSEDVVRERVIVYARETQPVLDFYRPRPTFRVINGEQAPDRVFHDLEQAVDALLGASERATAPARVEPRL
jgi:adenylate kinase